MSLPRIKISYLNGQLGTVGESPDGLFAIVCGAAAVGSFALETAYTIRTLSELIEMGVTEENGGRLYKHVSDFYSEAEDGTELVVMGVGKTATFTSLLDKTTGKVRELISGQNGKLRGVFVAGDGLNTGTAAEGLDPDVFTALPKAQALAEWATTELYAPLFVVLEGRGYTSGASLKDLGGESYNRVGVVIGDTESGSEGACIGTLAGRLAGLPVQRNCGRVKDGALSPLEMWIGTKKVEESNSAVADLYDKAYITPRKYVGKSGYYWADDRLACDETDDYAHLTNRRVIDKAYRTAYDTLLDMLLDELEVNEDGTLQTGVVKSWQQAVEDDINKTMTANGELSSTDDGEGCECWIDPDQDVLGTSKVTVTLKVRPHGYARYVDVDLGFYVES